MFATLSDGAKLYYDIGGMGLRPEGERMQQMDTLVLLHGGPGFDHTPFKTYFPRMEERFQILYYDHRGMGRSDASDPRHWNMQTWTDDLHELLGILGIERPVLLGQSFGGWIALRYATQHSQNLRGLILSSTGARSVAEDCFVQFEKLGGQSAVKIAKEFFEHPNQQTFDRYLRGCMNLYSQSPQSPLGSKRQILKPEVLFHFWRDEFRRFDLRPGVKEVACPAWVVTGMEDPITPTIRSQEIADLLPKLWNLDLIEGAGHGVYRDKPEWFQDRLYEFVGQLG